MGQLIQSSQSSSDIIISYADLAKENSGKIANDYTILSPPMAINAIGELRVAINKITLMRRIVKIYYRQFMRKEDDIRIQQEFQTLRFLDHPNIVRVYQFYLDKKNFYMVTEFYSGCSLFEQIIEKKSFTEKVAADLIKQILSAVNYIHSKAIVHRDIKPENIIYDHRDKTLKIVDFGVSRSIKSNELLDEKVGTPYYIAPEVLNRKYNQKCDVWSCGIILYTMVVGSPPIQGRDELEILYQIQKGNYDIDFTNISNKGINFIKKLLRRDPSKRPSAEEALQDDWIQHYSTQTNLNFIPNIRESLENMKKFHPDMKLQEAALFFIVNNLTTPEEKQDLQQQFSAMDLNHDGKLTCNELIAAFKILYKNIDAECEAKQIMDAVDKDLSGAIDFSEFVFAAMDRNKIVEKDRLQRAFMVFDQDHSGTISAEEFKRLFGNKISNLTVINYMSKVDENGDGQLSFDEFYKMMNGIVTMEQK